jgi:hypothetical protein
MKVKDGRRDALIQTLLMLFALLACFGGVWRMFDSRVQDRLDDKTLLYFGVAGALLLLRDVKSFAFGSYRIEFDRKLEELETKVENAQAAAVGRGGIARPLQFSTAKVSDRSGSTTGARTPFSPTPGAVEDDPWKGVFGSRTSGARALEGEVWRIGIPGFFRVQLRVRSTNPGRDPLRGSVQFFLHPTFGNDRPVVAVGPGGVAELTLTAWGSFTVGALADDGTTTLELDLAELPDAPPDFKGR